MSQKKFFFCTVVVALSALLAAFLALTCVPVHAQEAYSYFKNYDFTGGLNTATSPFLLKDNEARDMNNFLVTEAGAVEKRGGFVTFDTVPTGGLAISMFNYFPTLAAGEWVTHMQAGTTSSVQTLYSGSWIPLFTSVADDHYYDRTRFVNFLGKLYLTNMADGLRSYDGSTTAEVAAAPKCQFIATHGNRLYLGGDPLDPFTFYFSALRDGTTWDDTTLAGVNAGYWTLTSFKGGPIMGFANWQGMLLIFAENSIWALQGDYPEESSLTEIVQGVGCTAPDSIAVVAGEVFFKHVGKVYKMGNPPVDVSSRLEGYISDSDAAQAVAWDNNYVMINPDSDHTVELAASVETLLYDVEKNLWTKWNNLPWHAAATSVHPGGEDFMVARNDAAAVALYTPATYTDSWGNYTATWLSRVFTFDVPELNKHFRHMQFDLYGDPGEALFNYQTDYGRVSSTEVLTVTGSSVGSVLGSFVMGESLIGGVSEAADPVVTFKFPFMNKAFGKTFQFELTLTSSAYTILYGYVLRYRAKPFRGSAY